MLARQRSWRLINGAPQQWRGIVRAFSPRRSSSWAGVSSATFPQHTELRARRKGRGFQAAAASSEASTTATAPSQIDPASPEYDWKLGVALSGCSFEAYNDPEEQDGLMEVTPSGSRIVYTDKDFLITRMEGLLELTVKSASNLPVADMWPGKSDPYAIVQIGDSSGTTKVISSNLNPVWDETFYLYIRNMRQRLVIRVLDQDVGKSDDFLGSTMRGVADLCDGQRHQLSLELRGLKGAAGQVHLEARFMPFTDVLADEAAGEMGGPVRGSPGLPLLARMPETHLDTGKESPWRELQRLSGIARQSRFKPLAFVENTLTDSQAWLFWNPDQRTVCVAFRGTEQAKWRDILVDLSLVPSAFNPERVKAAPRNAALAEESKEPSLLSKVVDSVQWAKKEVGVLRAQREQEAGGAPEATTAGGAAALAALSAMEGTSEELVAMLSKIRHTIEEAQAGEEDQAQPWVHNGFLSAYDSIRPQVLGIIDTLLAADEEQGQGQGEQQQEQQPWRVYVTGHSLGGALATLCAYDLAARTGTNFVPPRITMVNFGSPRVGNKAFAQEFNQLVPDAWRVVNRNDAVCTVPRLMGYCHVGHAVRLKESGQIEVQRDTSDTLGEGVAAPEVLPVALPKLTERVLEKVGVEVALAAGVAEEDASAAAASAAPLTTDEVDSLLEQEMEAWSLLLSGSSVKEHLEDLYLESLKAFCETQSGGQPLSDSDD